MSRYTNWYPGTITPARAGMYERIFSGVFARWDGNQWMSANSDFEVAQAERVASKHKREHWRGLTEAAHKEGKKE